MSTLCSDLQGGAWYTDEAFVFNSGHYFDNHPVPKALGAHFEEYVERVHTLGNWYLNDAGYEEMRIGSQPTLEDFTAQEVTNLTAAWTACAEQVSGFPSAPDEAATKAVETGAQRLYARMWTTP